MRFEFATASRIVFGPGVLREVPALAGEFGSRALIVTGRYTGRAKRLVEGVSGAGLNVAVFSVNGEPDIEVVKRGAAHARETGAELVIGLGGGSALDAGKAIAAMAANDGEILDYLEVIGKALPLRSAPLPFIAIPTTAGTGSEATRNAVLASPEHGVKVSLRSPLMLPKVAVVDPELTFDLPPTLTASTGLDALTQLIEPYVCARANPLVDGLCREGIARAARSLRTAFREGNNPAAREDMAVASLFGGIALANAGLGAVHGFAGPIGGMFPAPHGAVCAALLPHVIAMNVKALRDRTPGSEALARYSQVARILTSRPDATEDDAVAWVSELVRDLRIPALRVYGMKAADVKGLVAKASKASSMKPNPIALTDDELSTILTDAI